MKCVSNKRFLLVGKFNLGNFISVCKVGGAWRQGWWDPDWFLICLQRVNFRKIGNFSGQEKIALKVMYLMFLCRLLERGTALTSGLLVGVCSGLELGLGAGESWGQSCQSVQIPIGPAPSCYSYQEDVGTCVFSVIVFDKRQINRVWNGWNVFQTINDGGDCRTAPATPGLLMSKNWSRTQLDLWI